MSIIDKRGYPNTSKSNNRKRFLDRCKKGLKKAVDRIIRDTDIKSIKGKKTVSSRDGTLDEPRLVHDEETGNPTGVYTNNREHKRGDAWTQPKVREVIFGGSHDGEEFDDDLLKDYQIILTKEEFMDLVFEEMELPDFVKEALTGSDKFKLKRAGTAPDGPVNRLNLEETFKMALGRRLATRAYLEEQDPPRKPPFITDEDLRYNLYDPEPLPIRKAVMFALRDDSGSMDQNARSIAKRFFWLLYLFLERQYDEIEIRFFLYSDRFKEVNELAFFKSVIAGGTYQADVIQHISNIITQEYDLDHVNIYLAQVSDGDDFGEIGLLYETALPLLEKLQYMAYLEVRSAHTAYRSPVMMAYENLKAHIGDKLNVAQTDQVSEIYNVLRELFKKR